jgi:N-methylhydantoinase B
MTAEPDLDPITFSVIMKRLESIADEMTLSIEHSAWSTLLSLNRDLSGAVYDRHGQQVSTAEALPIQVTTLGIAVAEIVADFGDDLRPGDVFLCNDPYRGNVHAGDLVTAAPVFADGVHVFWAVARAHHLDIGAFVASSIAASARSIYQEGMTIPPVRIMAGGALCRDVLNLFLANVRYRDVVEGDLLAQLGAVARGSDRLREVCDEFGTDDVLRYVSEIIAHADRCMSAELQTIPDGVYRGESWVDSDGVDAHDIPVRAEVTVRGDRVIVDFSGCGPQGKGGMNASQASAFGAGAIPFLFIAGSAVPHNSGSISHIEVRTVEGTIAHARFPASTSGGPLAPNRALMAAVDRAMATAIPDRVAAGGARAANAMYFVGAHADGAPWAVQLRNGVGGGGATSESDGWPLIEGGGGGLKVQSIEEIELRQPLVVDEMEIATDSMGFGRHIGGPGIRFAVRTTGAGMECLAYGDGAANPPHGIAGGTRGIGGGNYIDDPQQGRRRFVTAIGHTWIDGHETWVGESSGGGGHGNPLDRVPERVREDVRDEIVSRAAAHDVFGVVLSPEPDPVLDAPATERLRAERRAAGPPPAVDPIVPAAATWIADHIRPEDVIVVNATR